MSTFQTLLVLINQMTTSLATFIGIKNVSFLAYCLLFYICTIPIFALAATYQEHKVWKLTSRPLTLWGLFKVLVLNFFWMVMFGIGSLATFPLMLISAGGGGRRSMSVIQNVVVEKLTAILLYKVIVGNVKVINQQNIPYIDIDNPTKPAPVFIANHCSQIDTCVIYFVLKRFKWIAKHTVKFMPGVGFSMVLGRHIFVQRKGKNRKSASNLYEQSNKAIQAGIPLMIFPQGTRCIAEKLPFKDGAFKIAVHNETQIVPISIDIPVNIWNRSYPLSLIWSKESDNAANLVKVTVHEPIQVTKASNKAELKEKCANMIYSVFPSIYHNNDEILANDMKVLRKKQ